MNGYQLLSESRFFCRAIFIIVVLASHSVSADTKQSEDQLSFEIVLSHALASSPLVKEIDAKVSAQLAEALELRLIPNPELSAELSVPVSYESERGENEYQVAITQPFRISHLGIRSTVSSLLEQAARADQKFSLIELTQSVRLAYVKLWALQQQRAYFVGARERAGKIGQFVADGASKGLFSLGEEKIFAAEAERASADLTGLEAEINKAKAELLRLSNFSIGNRSLGRPVITSNATNAFSSDRDSTVLPIQDRYLLLEKVAREQFRLAKNDAFPALSPELSYSHSEEGREYVGVGLTFELPFSNRNQAEKLQRSAELQAATARRKFTQSATFKSQVNLLVESLRGSIAHARTYEEKVVPALESAIVTYEKQLRAGQATILLVWQTQRELLELQERLLEVWILAFSNESELAILTGKEF